MFHKTCYHPGNAMIFFYGDDDTSKRLELLEEYLGDPTSFKLDNTTASNTSNTSATQIQWQKRWGAPREIQLPYIVAPSDDSGGLDAGTDAVAAGAVAADAVAADGTADGTADGAADGKAGEKAEEKRHMLTVNWLVNDAPLTPVERLELVVLDELLLGTTAAPLRDAMTSSGLGSAMTGGGLADHLMQAYFAVGLKDVAEKDLSAVKDLVATTMKELSEGRGKDGQQSAFTAEAVDAAFNTIEFQLRENNTEGYPRGLGVMLRALNEWNYDLDPMDALRYVEFTSFIII